MVSFSKRNGPRLVRLLGDVLDEDRVAGLLVGHGAVLDGDAAGVLSALAPPLAKRLALRALGRAPIDRDALGALVPPGPPRRRRSR